MCYFFFIHDIYYYNIIWDLILDITLSNFFIFNILIIKKPVQFYKYKVNPYLRYISSKITIDNVAHQRYLKIAQQNFEVNRQLRPHYDFSDFYILWTEKKNSLNNFKN